MYTRVKNAAEIESMRVGGRVLAETLELLKQKIVPGVSAAEIDKWASDALNSAGVKPSFLGYQGFPGSICVSVNDEVVHGIPSSGKIIQKGDVVSLDLGVTSGGMIVDGAISFLVDSKDSDKTRLLQTTERSLEAALAVIKHGCRVGDISASVEAVLSKQKLGIIRDLVGHGVGHAIHEDPNIPNYGPKGTGPQLFSGMTIAIEPMATLGGEDIYIGEDKWTVKTKDGSISAQFEHTVLITDDGCEILTSSNTG